MTLIADLAKDRFLAQKTFKRSNTEVLRDQWHWYLELHGNRIARYPVGKDWAGDGELRTCGWNGPTTLDRLNALPGVSLFSSRQQVWLGLSPLLDDYAWVPKVGGHREPCSRREDKARRVFSVLLNESPAWPAWPLLRDRGEMVVIERSADLHGQRVRVLARSWAKEPLGEIIIPRTNDRYDNRTVKHRLYFQRWQDFLPAWAEAQRLCLPPLVQLGMAFTEIENNS
jgi:hypothetical protein